MATLTCGENAGHT